MKKVILTTGGTGGHIYPALSIADEFKKRGVDVLFVGTSTRMEKDLVPKNGYKFRGLDIVPSKSFDGIKKMVLAILEAIKIIKEYRPDVIVGFGNYISVPILLAGLILNKKIYLQEQNANIGLTNKIFYRFAKKFFLAFEKTFDEVPEKYQHKLQVSGNPLRGEIERVNRSVERENLKLGEDEKLLLITGGSLGAKDINDAVLEEWANIYENKKVRIYWATGEKNYQEIANKISRVKANDVIKPYFDNMINIMAAADLVICRAGALTISELIELEKPSLLIPYNSLKVGQYENAKILEELNASKIYKNSEAKSAVQDAMKVILNDNKLKEMSLSIKSLKKRNAAEEIVEEINIWER